MLHQLDITIPFQGSTYDCVAILAIMSASIDLRVSDNLTILYKKCDVDPSGDIHKVFGQQLVFLGVFNFFSNGLNPLLCKVVSN